MNPFHHLLSLNLNLMTNYLKNIIHLFLFMNLMLTATSLKGQSVHKTFDTNHHSIKVNTIFSKLQVNSPATYLEFPASPGLNGGYHYIITLNNFYGIGLGAELGYLQYMIQPTNPNLDLYYSKTRLMNIRLPIYINRYYPFNKNIAMNIKTGLSVNAVISSLVTIGSFGGIDRNRLYDTYAQINSAPQTGLLFDLGVAYRIKHHNFISVNFIVNYNFQKKVKANYNYYPVDSEEVESGSLYTKSSFVGVSLSYNFKIFNNEGK